MTNSPAQISGERSLVQIPVKLGTIDLCIDAKAYLESVGFEFLGICEEDPLFQNVKLPLGWKIVTDDSVIYAIADDKDRYRFFFSSLKKGSRDRYILVIFSTRYKYWHNSKSFMKDGSIVVDILDGENVIYTMDIINFSKETDKMTAIDIARAEADRWLDKRYPNHHSVTAYWED